MRNLITEQEISRIVNKLADQINKDFSNQEVVAVGILKGSVIFLADLIRQLEMPLVLDFIQVSSYRGTQSTGEIIIKKDLAFDIKDKNILIIEDIIDTGVTLNSLKKIFMERGPKSLKVVTLLDKPSRRKVEFKADYIGREIPDEFVVGYGLDYDEKFRNLPYVGIYEK